MFEETLVESRGLVGTGTQRWTALGSLAVQCAMAGLLLAVPLLRPEMVRVPPAATPVAVPFLRKPPVLPVEIKTASRSSTTMRAMSLPAAGPALVGSRAVIFSRVGELTDGPVATVYPDLRMGSGGPSLPSAFGVGTGTSPSVVVVRAREGGPVRVSQGVSEGMLLTPIQPVYPGIAKAVRLQGAVVLEAVISKAGKIESLRAVSGPEMLRRAALDAVSVARYRPYLLNGEPTEVKTTITIVFSMGS